MVVGLGGNAASYVSITVVVDGVHEKPTGFRIRGALLDSGVSFSPWFVTGTTRSPSSELGVNERRCLFNVGDDSLLLDDAARLPTPYVASLSLDIAEAELVLRDPEWCQSGQGIF